MEKTAGEALATCADPSRTNLGNSAFEGASSDKHRRMEMGELFSKRYARARLAYLREQKPWLLRELERSGRLLKHLLEVEDRALDLHAELFQKMTAKLDQSLKETDFLEYVRLANATDAQVREIVLAEAVFR